MDKLKIKTDNKWRYLLYGYELPKGKRKDFDYLPEEALDCRDFIKYRGVYYDLGEFLRIPTTFPEEMKKWDRYTSASYFSGVVIKYAEDRNQVKIGTYFS